MFGSHDYPAESYNEMDDPVVRQLGPELDSGMATPRERVLK